MALKPSLRNYAVIRRIEWHFWGSVWSISDRRTGSKSFLIRPSLIVSWPRIYSALYELEPIALKLRNNKVVLLSREWPIPTLQMGKRIFGRNTAVQLDPFEGFVERRRRRSMVAIAVPAVLVGAYLLSLGRSGNPEGLNPAVATCSTLLEPGLEIEAQSSQFRSGGDRYRVLSVKQSGGFSKIVVRRSCDSKTFRLSAWYEGDVFTVSKVD